MTPSQLMENNEALSQIEKAGAMLAECLKTKDMFTHVVMVVLCVMRCILQKSYQDDSRKDRPALGAIAMGDGAHITCSGNDFGFDYIFSRFVEAQGRTGDVLVGISTSGRSKNVIEAAKKAKELGLKVIILTGKPNSELGKFADVEICTPGGKFADRVQELHIKVIHILIELVEREMFNQEY